ncbi:uncharacterized protein K460DRAFT_259368, partial [Cucurbitaria berberidis CBS 394.84]
LTTPYLTAEGYYKRAWRDILRTQHPRWKEPLVRRNLAYLWASRTHAEQVACENLVASNALVLPDVDLGILPLRTVPKGWAAHPRAHERLAARAGVGVEGGGDGDGEVDGDGDIAMPTQGPDPALPALIQEDIEPDPVVVAPVNTTNFAFWPTPEANTAISLPRFNAEEEEWLESDIYLPGEEGEERLWRGITTLGRGATGRVGLWVKVDETRTIRRRIAVKDIASIYYSDWVNPMNWRDKLPRDVAIQERVRMQGGHRAIHRYEGYRLSLPGRRYRLYHEVCEYGNLMTAMDYYSKQWRRRRNRPFPAKKEPEHVIPEAFLWEVFRNLVEACTFLERGAGVDMGAGKEWRSIVHNDMHL